MKTRTPRNKKPRSKGFRITITVLLIAAIIAVVFATVVNIWMISSTSSRIVALEELEAGEYDCILVLGAGVRDDGSPSHMLEDRLIKGIELFESGCSNTILMSGDHGRIEYDEVNTMKNYAITAGIPEDRIFMDHAGFSTYDSLYRVRDIFGAKKVIIVTQKYHLYRALAIADSLGLEAVGISADLRTYYGQLTREAREVAARVKDFFYIVFQPEPVVLGDTISFEDSGDVTNG